MVSETKCKVVRKTNKRGSSSRGGCLVIAGVIIGVVISTVLVDWGFVIKSDRELELRSVMETFYFGDGLAHLSGDTSILESVVTERMLQRQIDHCNKGLCDGGYPPHAIGEYFRIVNLTDEFAVVELERRAVITDLDRKPGSYLTICFSLLRDGDDWRVDGAYLNCNEYLPDKYK